MPQAVADPNLADPMDPTSPLSLVLRQGSREVHRAAESSDFLRRLMTAGVEPSGYLAYLERLAPVYAALERAVHQRRDDPVVGALHDDRLARSAALAGDLRHWRTVTSTEAAYDGGAPGPAVAAYLSLIRAASRRPWLLVAHHYTRYLGDLSGGQMMRRRLADQLGSDAGLAFYDFPAIADPGSYKRDYRRRLDRLGLDPDQRTALLAEVRAAFAANRALLAELDHVG